MVKEIKLSILPDGRIKFKRGDKEYNKILLEILRNVVYLDSKTKENIEQFLRGSEEVKMIVGETIFCG